MPAIEVTNLSFTYPTPKTKALHNVSFHIRQGEFVGLIGLNNAGKSSLLYTLTGVIPHLYNGEMQGNVSVLGQDTAQTSVAETAASIGFVMQNPEKQLSGVCFTVREEIAFALENRGVAREEMIHRVAETMRITGLTELADRSPHTLSGGQLQQVILASTLVCNTPILVLDEPTASLDPVGAQRLYDTLLMLQNKGITIIIADQRLEHIAQYTNRTIVLHQGAILLDGPSKTTLTSPILQQTGMTLTRFTQVAELAKEKELWRAHTPLATTLDDTVEGLTVK